MELTAFDCTRRDIAAKAARDLSASSGARALGCRWPQTTQTVHSDFASSSVNLLELRTNGFHNHVIQIRADTLDSIQFQRLPVGQQRSGDAAWQSGGVERRSPVPTDDVLILTGKAALPPGTLTALTDTACFRIPKATGLPSGTATIRPAFAAARRPEGGLQKRPSVKPINGFRQRTGAVTLPLMSEFTILQ